ncbi:MAG: UDP-N-acetylmuramoyl-L-alanyl-D-glutamate--2,6-diaminopimelate ligase [Firmicutes bacterium]|nr:UDP-N-acetylmuramoyl-L-alanyl-D-glutamate--2,6-diaminopimelate ligase [Bacillota bacterium]
MHGGDLLYKDDRGWHLSPAVQGVTLDSREVRPGYIFVAVKGAHHDGHAYVGEAVRAGAVAVVGETPVAAPVPFIRVPSARRALAELAAAWWGHPARSLTVVGVTGTNGKTSVVYWLTQVLREAGIRTGMVSSVAVETGRRTLAARLTTPESPDLQRYLAEMRDSGLTHAVIEVSSHGIVQERIGEIGFHLAILTNVTREHLDFHLTMENYMLAKARLFERLVPEARGAVINADDASASVMRSHAAAGPVVGYGLDAGEVRARALRLEAWSSRFVVEGLGDRGLPARLPHPGRYNVYNALAVAAAAVRLGVEPRRAVETLARLGPVPGRMQIARSPDGVLVVVDYAHTPDGLGQALAAVRRFAPGDIWTVFGARGGRDRGKRPEMGRVAARWARHVLLTTDSPNDEDPAVIAAEIAAGIPGEVDSRFIADRAEAIRVAVEEARPGDIVLITGRGPERTQTFHGRAVPMVDADAVQAALARRGAALPAEPGREECRS